MYLLDYSAVDEIIYEISEFLQRHDIDRQTIIKTRISIEEILLKYIEKNSEAVNCELVLTERFGQTRILLKIGGDGLDPNADFSEEDKFYNMCLQNMGQAPMWRYRNGVNRILVTFSKKRKISLASLQIAAVIAAIATGFVLKSFIAPEKCLIFCDAFLDPVYSAIMGLISGTAIFYILFSILNGICSMGDMATFNRIGKMVFKRIFIVMAFATVAIILMCAAVFPVSSGGSLDFDAVTLWKMIVDIIPVNLVSPFLEGNTLQVSFLAIVIGIVILMLGENAKSIYSIVLDMTNVTTKMLELIVNLLPIAIFISIFTLVMDDGLNEMIGYYKFPLFLLIADVIFAVFFVVKTCIVQRVSIVTFVRKIMPVAIIGLMTSSSVATASESSNICDKKLGIDKQIVLMGWPINTTFLSVAVLTDVVIATLITCECFGVPITVSMMITLGLNGYILAMTVPKMSGGTVAAYTLIFGLLGIPPVGMSILISLQVIADPITTCLGTILVHCELVQQADKAGLLNKDILAAKDTD